MRRLILVSMFLCAPARAQDMNTMHGMAPGPSSSNASASDAAYTAAMDRMMAGMKTTPTGNPDADFVAGMIPHHQGAIDMARVELKYGKDPTLRHLATQIIAAQTREIAYMRIWQAKHAPK